jgi:hypothetical protein
MIHLLAHVARLAVVCMFVLAPLAALAAGRISLEPRYDIVNQKTSYTLGLGVYEKITSYMAYNSWTGFGYGVDREMQADDNDWYNTKHQLDFSVSGLTLSPGMRFSYSPKYGDLNFDTLNTEAYMRLSVRVW